MSRLLSLYKRLYKFYGPQTWWPAKARFEVIVGAILTQNTAWSNVEKAIRNLKERSVLSPVKMRKLKAGTLTLLIKPAGYYNVKSGRLKNFISFLFKNYGGSLDKLSSENTASLREKLLGINGIGPETCDSILLYAFKKPTFVVDAYTRRIFSRHKFIKESDNYHEIQAFFMSNLPKSERLYNEYHALIVRLAKEHCRTKPRCEGCPLERTK